MKTIILPFPPTTGNHLWKHTKSGRHYLVPKVKEYYDHVSFAVRQQGGALGLSGPVSLEVRVYPPDRRRRDLSNILKIIEDALTRAGVWGDDSQVERILMVKMLVVQGGRIGVYVEHVEQAAH